jgi:hypothetical protein
MKMFECVQQLPPDIFYNVAEEHLLAHEFESELCITSCQLGFV